MCYGGTLPKAIEARTSSPLRVMRAGAGHNQEAGPLVLAVAFSAHNTLTPTDALEPHTALDDIPDKVRPSAAVSRTLRELDLLGIPLTLAGDLPAAVLKGMANALWFPGDVVSDARPLPALLSKINLPASCIWFVTADANEAQTASEMGLTTVHVSPNRSNASEASDVEGIYVVAEVDELLELIRAPYTRSALSLRLIIGALLSQSDDEFAP